MVFYVATYLLLVWVKKTWLEILTKNSFARLFLAFFIIVIINVIIVGIEIIHLIIKQTLFFKKSDPSKC